jgi:hypothetical protein
MWRGKEIATLRSGWVNRRSRCNALNDVIFAFAVGLAVGIPVSIKIGSYYLHAISSDTFFVARFFAEHLFDSNHCNCALCPTDICWRSGGYKAGSAGGDQISGMTS